MQLELYTEGDMESLEREGFEPSNVTIQRIVIQNQLRIDRSIQQPLPKLSRLQKASGDCHRQPPGIAPDYSGDFDLHKDPFDHVLTTLNYL